MALKTKQDETVTVEAELVTNEPEEVKILPDYAILNPDIPMGAKVNVAINVANTLAPLVRSQGLVVKGLNRNNKEAEYVTVEGWEILGTFLGIVPVTTIIKEVKSSKHDHTVGYVARATLYQNPIIENDEIIGYQFVSLGKFTDFIKAGDTPNDAWEKAKGQYGRVADAVKIIDPRKE